MRMALLANLIMSGLACVAWGVYGKGLTEFFSAKTHGCKKDE